MNMTTKKFTRIKREILKKNILVTGVTTKIALDKKKRSYARVDITWVKKDKAITVDKGKYTYRFHVPVVAQQQGRNGVKDPRPDAEAMTIANLKQWCSWFEQLVTKSIRTSKYS